MVQVVTEVSPEFLARRRAQGNDKFDEVWDGVLHLMPPPHMDHQRLQDGLAEFFRAHWERLGLGKTSPETGVRRAGAGRWSEAPDGEDVPDDYRVPDRVWVLPERYDRIRGGWIVGGPDVVLEVLSPGARALAKLPWYHAQGVREVLLIDRVTRAVRLLRRGPAAWEEVAPDPDGWLASEVLDTALRREDPAPGEEAPTLVLRRSGAPERTVRIGG